MTASADPLARRIVVDAELQILESDAPGLVVGGSQPRPRGSGRTRSRRSTPQCPGPVEGGCSVATMDAARTGSFTPTS